MDGLDCVCVCVCVEGPFSNIWSLNGFLSFFIKSIWSDWQIMNDKLHRPILVSLTLSCWFYFHHFHFNNYRIWLLRISIKSAFYEWEKDSFSFKIVCNANILITGKRKKWIRGITVWITFFFCSPSTSSSNRAMKGNKKLWITLNI